VKKIKEKIVRISPDFPSFPRGNRKNRKTQKNYSGSREINFRPKFYIKNHAKSYVGAL